MRRARRRLAPRRRNFSATRSWAQDRAESPRISRSGIHRAIVDWLEELAHGGPILERVSVVPARMRENDQADSGEVALPQLRRAPGVTRVTELKTLFIRYPTKTTAAALLRGDAALPLRSRIRAEQCPSPAEKGDLDLACSRHDLHGQQRHREAGAHRKARRPAWRARPQSEVAHRHRRRHATWPAAGKSGWVN